MRKDDRESGRDAYEQETTTDLKDTTADAPTGWPLHTRIVIALVVGVVAGVLSYTIFGVPDPASPGEKISHPNTLWIINNITDPVGQLFLRLLLMTVVPLVFSSLIVGVAAIGDPRKLGRVGLKSFAYTMVISLISVVIGLTLANTIKPGKRIDADTRARLEQRYGGDASKLVAKTKSDTDTAGKSVLTQIVETVVPKNPVTAVASETPNMLHLMFFGLVLGIAATLIPAKVAQPFLQALQGLYEVCAKIIDLIMKFAPYAIACLLFTNTARFGLDLLIALGWFVATVLLGLSLHMFGVYSIAVALLSRISPLEFFRRIKTAMLTAFSTSSSNATLPTSLRVAEENLGIPREINSFVLTVGATANQNGSALYEGVTVLFLAQLAGFDLTILQQLMIAYLAVLGSIGTAGVPSGSIPFIVVVLAGVSPTLPPLIAIILGVDRILDMCRTTVNVTGDLTIATYIARSEGYPLLNTRDGGKF